jgi:nicotinamidase-related amidase
MKSTRIVSCCIAAAAAVITLVFFGTATLSASDIISEWNAVKVPPVPQLKPVSVDVKTTALLILDMAKRNCGVRPRCIETVPNVKRLHDAARTAGAMVFYTGSPDDIIDKGFAPRDGEWIAQQGPDKFLGSNMEERLKARGIKTVIVCGTSAQGVVIGTGSAAAQRGYNVVVPVDCMSSEDAYMEQYTAWHMFKGGPAVVTSHTTLTRSDMIKF